MSCDALLTSTNCTPPGKDFRFLIFILSTIDFYFYFHWGSRRYTVSVLQCLLSGGHLGYDIVWEKSFKSFCLTLYRKWNWFFSNIIPCFFIVYFRYVSIKLAYKQHQIKHLCSDAVTKIIQCYILTSLCLLLITNDFASFHSIIYEKYVELSLEFFISEYVRSMLLQHGVLFLSFWWKEKKIS